MKNLARLPAFLLFLAATVYASEHARLLDNVNPLPMRLDSAFQFRKTKLFALGVAPPPEVAKATTGKKKVPSGGGSRLNAAVAEASIAFEGNYRNYGAVTQLDMRERNGNYLDFFWRAKRDADLTVRLEYRTEKLRAFVQARELHYANARGSHKSEFTVIGDDYYNDGAIIAWRCLMIENGHIVAENRSYLWR